MSPTLLLASKEALGLGCCDWRWVVLSLSLGQHRMDSPSATGEDSSCFCRGSEESSTTGPGQRYDEIAVGPGYRSKLNNRNITTTLIKMDLQEMGRKTVCHQKRHSGNWGKQTKLPQNISVSAMEHGKESQRTLMALLEITEMLGNFLNPGTRRLMSFPARCKS